MSADVVNLRRERKRRGREARATQASENRAKFGRSKTEAAADVEAKRRLDAFLDDHKRDGG